MKSVKYFILFSIFLTPILSSASTVCSQNGYTVLTMNGIFTNQKQAEENKKNLGKIFSDTYNGQPLRVDFVHNPSHLAGLGDILKSAVQGLLDSETIQDYDLTQMLETASQKITTQKVLIVAHSQGNFYANSFYDVVAGQVGGIPKESIGVYAVATPSGKTSGGGTWLTSSTDQVIAVAVGKTLGRKIMPPNISIELAPEDGNGHSFSGVYLKYRSERIVSDIEKSLNNLSNNSLQKENNPCMDPPKISLGHKLTGVFFTVADPVARFSGDAVSEVYVVSNVILKSGGGLVASGLNTANTILNTAGSFVFSAGKLLASSASTRFGSLNTKLIAEENITDSKKDINLDEKTEENSAPSKLAVKEEKKVVEEIVKEVVEGKTEDKKELAEDKKIPGIIEIVPIIPKQNPGGKVKTANSPQINSNTGGSLLPSTQRLSAPLCDNSISVTGCLLSTTTVSIFWESEPDATGYIFSVNGVTSSTTGTDIILDLDDFSEYVFEMSPTFSELTKETSTSTLSFSVATIPIAINEISFLGTIANENDEWIELKNNTNHSIDLSNWAMRINNGETTLPLSGTIVPKGYVLIMRGENALVLNNGTVLLGWDEGSQNILNDVGEKIVLMYGENNFDSTPFWNEDNSDFDWSADKESVERKSSKVLGENFSNWGTNMRFIKNGEDSLENEVYGTPGAHNSLSYLINDGNTLINSDLTLDPENGPYAVFDTIVVSASSTLTIPGGTTVYFIEDSFGNEGNFYVPGRVVAGGGEEAVIFESFHGNQTGYFWFNSESATSTFKNVIFEKTDTIGLANSSKVEIQDSSFINSSSGLNAYNGASLTLKNVTIANTTGEAVAGYNNTYVSIASSTITNTFDADAISSYNNSVIYIEDVVIENSENDGIAIYSSTAHIASTTVSGTENNGVALYTSTTTISNLDLSDTAESALYIISGKTNVVGLTVSDFQSGYAVEVASPSDRAVADVTITDSVIVGDSEDVYEQVLGSIVLEDVVFCDSAGCLAE